MILNQELSERLSKKVAEAIEALLRSQGVTSLNYPSFRLITETLPDGNSSTKLYKGSDLLGTVQANFQPWSPEKGLQFIVQTKLARIEV